MELSKNKNKSLLALFRKNNSKQLLLIIFCLFAVFLGYKGSKALKTKGYIGIIDFITTVTSNYWQGLSANPELISIEIKDVDMKVLEKNRNQALERGLIINDLDGEYVPATLEYNGKKMKIKLRLKGHMTDHIETDNKWSFRIKVKEGDTFMGMTRFSIQQPGTRGYAYEWIYHELIRRENIIALRYKFINVSVNGKDWGIYAVEENFDDELTENNGREKAPILRLNPDLYWVKRYNGVKKENVLTEFASYYSANFEAYQEDKILPDSIQKQYYLKAIALAEGFRNRKLSVAQVFDINRLAKFHAIIDLVGGEHSIDWSDIKYYYNPITKKLEPVAYESFSSFPVTEISGNYRYVSIDSTDLYEDWHTAIFSDSLFFKAYVNNLERITIPQYLDTFFSSSNEELQKNLAIIYKEYPYKKFEKKSYYINQQRIKKILSPPKSFHAYFESVSQNQIHIQLGSIESLPIEIKTLVVAEKSCPPLNSIVLDSKQKNKNITYRDYTFFLPLNFVFNDSLTESLKIQYSILGSSEIKEDKVYPFPHTDNEFIAEELKNKKGNFADFSFLSVDDSNKIITVNAGKNVINKDLIIPQGYIVVAPSGVSIDIRNKSKIVSYSAFKFNGSEDNMIRIESSDSSSQGIEFINAPKSVFNYVSFSSVAKINKQEWHRIGGLTFYESPFKFNDCSFSNFKAEDAINAIRSDFELNRCLFKNMHDDGLDADYSNGIVANTVFEDCKENGIDVMMTKINVTSVYISGSRNKAINVKAGAQLTGKDVKIKNSNIAISAEDQSSITLQGVDISKSGVAFTAYKNKPHAGYPTINVTKVVTKDIKTKCFKEKKATVFINGKEITEEVDNVEAIIKDGKNKGK